MIRLGAKYHQTLALCYKEHGIPENVVSLAEFETKESPNSDEISIRMLVAPINPSDINQIQGKYAILPSLPAVGGNEGIGIVTQVGNAVKHLEVGDHVIPIQSGQGTWRKQLLSCAESWMKIPKDIPVNHASMLAVNPCTAFRMLKDFVTLEPGDIVLQNGANSAVGQAVIQLARAMNIHTINVIRDRPNLPEAKEKLKHLGASLVCTEEELSSDPAIMAEIASLGPQKIRLALNCVGGKSLTSLVRLLAPSSTVVTYGGMSKEPSLVSTSSLIFQDISYRGFWISKWKETHSREDCENMMDSILSIVRKGGFRFPDLDLRPIGEFRQALIDAQKPYRDCKLAFDLDYK
jgi:mitochondrial enoyl-[acyl-carrier protein] reductase / trans-2-enoyl-CoA reductase